MNAHKLQKEAAEALGLPSEPRTAHKRKERLFAAKNPGLEQRNQADMAQEMVTKQPAPAAPLCAAAAHLLTAPGTVDGPEEAAHSGEQSGHL